MEEQRRAARRQINSWFSWRKQWRLPKQNIQRRKEGGLFRYFIIVVPMQPWQKTHLKLQKWMLILEASSKWCETGGEMANYRRLNIHLVYLKACESLRRRGGSIHVRLLGITWEKFWPVANFQNEKSRIEWFLVEDKVHLMYMLSKFHCELNHIERV